eukprot:jgi/Botrbrau1/6187/Bobra.0344s0027.1
MDSIASVSEPSTQQETVGVPEGEQNAQAVAEIPPQLREDQIQNALAFLNHPKVRSAADSSKREFLTKKGLTEAEINEAFRRVPAAPPVTAPTPTVPSAAPPKPYPTATVEAMQPLQIVPAQPQQPEQQPIRWTQVAIGVGFLAATAYTLQQYVVPHVLAWLRPGPSKAAEEKNLGEVIAAVIQKQTEEVAAMVDVTKQLVARLEKEERGKAPSLQELRAELRSLANTLQSSGRSGRLEQGDLERIVAEFRQAIGSAPLPPSTHPPTAYSENGQYTYHGPATVAPPASRAAIPAARAPTNASAAPRGYQSDMYGGSLVPSNTAAAASGARQENGWSKPSSVASEDGHTYHQPVHPHSASYMEVLEMLENGITPPNVRTDIVDTPPNPEQAPPESRLAPREKPWLSSSSSSRPAAPEANTHGVPGLGAGPGLSSGPGPAPAAGLPSMRDAPDGSSSGGALPGGWRPPEIPQRSIPFQQQVGSSQDYASTASLASQPGPSSSSIPV